MNQRLLKLLTCPSCQKTPQLISFDGGSPNPGVSLRNGDGEVVSGALKCECGVTYPIIDGVPRFLENGLIADEGFAATYKAQLENVNGRSSKAPTSMQNGAGEDYENIRKSFSQEWGLFDYDSDKTWGWSLDQRKAVFLSDVGLKPDQLAGQKLLDGGCGNGTLSAALSTFGLEVTGLDLNDGLGRAYKNRSKYTSADAAERVQYVQGNLVTPPLQPGSFDLVYSSGVIHHTPSSKRAFASLSRMPRKGGRMYVWVYCKRGWPVRGFFGVGRSLKQWMSLKAVLRICQMLAPLHKMAAVCLDALGLMKFRPRTTREITLDLFDAFAPRFNHWHTEAEVRSWFEEYGFENIQPSGIQKHGFGMYGDKR